MSRCFKFKIAHEAKCYLCEEKAVYKMMRKGNTYLCCQKESCRYLAEAALAVGLADDGDEDEIEKARLCQ